MKPLEGLVSAVLFASLLLPMQASAQAKGLVVLLDAGHGIGDKGASGFVQEDDVNLDIALKTGKILESMGVRVIQARPGANFPGFSYKQSLKASANLMVSIHCNADGGSGTETYYGDARGDTASTPESRKLAQAIQNRLVSALGTQNRGVKRHWSRIYTWGGPDIPAVLPEIAFVDSASDAKVLSSEQGRQAAAQAIAAGIMDYASGRSGFPAVNPLVQGAGGPEGSCAEAPSGDVCIEAAGAGFAPRPAAAPSSFAGQLSCPLPGYGISSGFGPRSRPTAGASSNHGGLDIAAPSGVPVKAAAAGLATATTMGGYGNVVVIEHGASPGGRLQTLYGHLSRQAFSGQKSVAAGEVIGYVGSTGVSTGPHLHFEVRLNGAPVNPLSFARCG